MRAGRGVAADLHLHALEAAGAVSFGLAGDAVDALALLVEPAAGIGLDPVAAGPEQLIDRHFRDLAGDVPQRDVDAADRVHDDAAPPVLPGAHEHLLPQPLDHQRVLADEQRLQILLDTGRGGAAARPRLADADRAVIGLDLDQQRPASRLHPRGAGVRRLAFIGERDRADVLDLHGDLLPASSCPNLIRP